MAQETQTASIAAPGFFGLNIQESAVSLSSGFALEANNCVIVIDWVKKYRFV